MNPAQVLAIPVFIIGVAAMWLLARASGRRGPGLARFLLLVQFLLLVGVLIFGVSSKPFANPHGLIAVTTAMIPVSPIPLHFPSLPFPPPLAPSPSLLTTTLTPTP